MKLSELIQQLNEELERNGDVPVIARNSASGELAEVNCAYAENRPSALDADERSDYNIPGVFVLISVGN